MSIRLGCCSTGDGNRNDKENKAKSRRRRWIVIAVLVTAGAAALYYTSRNGTDIPQIPQVAEAGTTPVVTADQITFPEQAFADGKARYFSYRSADGITIRYFILKSSDGVIRAAFDACDVCFPAGKGYFQKSDFMVCRNCGRQFQSTKVNVVTGGCNPSALNRNILGGKVVIQVKDLLQGKRYFSPAGR